MLTNEEFFDTAAGYYNEMTDFASALKKRTAALRKFAEGVTSAADIGCGTGIDSIALSLSGVNVDAFDKSAGMIEAAGKNASRLNAGVNFYNYAAGEIPENFHGKYGLVASLGNTLSNVDAEKLDTAIGNIFSLLQPGGKFLMQILNYELILNQQERIINITAGEKYHYLRFYDFHPDYLQFNIIKYSSRNIADREMISTKLFPHTTGIVLPLLEKSGFTDVSLYGDLNSSTYDKAKSKDLIVLCRKPV